MITNGGAEAAKPEFGTFPHLFKHLFLTVICSFPAHLWTGHHITCGGDTTMSKDLAIRTLTVSERFLHSAYSSRPGKPSSRDPWGAEGKTSGFGGESSFPSQRLILQIIQRISLPPNCLVCSKQDGVLEEYRLWAQSQDAAGPRHLWLEGLWEMYFTSLSPRFNYKMMAPRGYALQQGLGWSTLCHFSLQHTR